RRIFSTVFGPHDPAFTVGSFAISAIRRPPTSASPVTTPSAPRPSCSQLASRPSSAKLSGSTRRATRSRTGSFPCSAVFWRWRSGPPASAASRAARNLVCSPVSLTAPESMRRPAPRRPLAARRAGTAAAAQVASFAVLVVDLGVLVELVRVEVLVELVRVEVLVELVRVEVLVELVRVEVLVQLAGVRLGALDQRPAAGGGRALLADRFHGFLLSSVLVLHLGLGVGPRRRRERSELLREASEVVDHPLAAIEQPLQPRLQHAAPLESLLDQLLGLRLRGRDDLIGLLRRAAQQLARLLGRLLAGPRRGGPRVLAQLAGLTLGGASKLLGLARRVGPQRPRCLLGRGE